ncbi:glycosyltransferase family 4 protein [Patescibacteria group bacterium]|nr:glycosyltransferase family 4 protein [Patescibacteria group bacterium]MBU4512520.1 glycosyltransferase family 4 protein [Patescibacteria group bacterium]MCG2693501.1 glycosyltransferase family 4 protein [Candidatus Parcubacteria bacterium]
MNLRILIFSLAYFPHVGGAEVAIREITGRLSDFEFDMITWNIDAKKNKETRNKEIKKLRDANTTNAKLERVGNVNVYRISCPKFLFPVYAYRKAKELHKLNNYQIVWGMMANLAGLGALLFKLRFNKVKFLLTLQTGNDDKKVWQKTWWWRPLYKMIYRKADYIQAISNYLAERGKRFGAKCRIEIIPNGVDLSIFQETRKKKQETKAANITDIGLDDKVIITASRLVEKNGLSDLIRAIQLSQPQPKADGPLSQKAGPPLAEIINYQLSIKLLIAGVGELEGELKNLVNKLGLGDKVFFLGQVDHEELAKLYNVVSVFVRPSLSEGLGSAFLEAMGAGVPVIATPVGGIPDFLKDGETGWFCGVKNPKSIAGKIDYILDEKNKDEVTRVIENARKLVEEEYNWEKIAQKMDNIFKSLL